MIVFAESIYQIFAPLFTVKFLHEGYATLDENFLQQGIFISPDAATKELFKNYKMDYRFYNNTLVCFIQSNLLNPPAQSPKIPSISITDNIQIRFLVQASSAFFSKTYVVAAGSKKAYQFSNQTDNANGIDLFLTAPVENYLAAGDYDSGTIVQDGGFLYATLQAVKGADHIAITDVAHWKKLQATEEVVSNADLKPVATVKADEKCFAVIDFYNNGTNNDSYKLFDVGGELFDPPPSFIIKFRSIQ